MARLSVVFSLVEFFIVSVVSVNGWAPRPDLYFVGSEPADIRDYPYLATVRLHKTHICGASIISRNWVITTATCLSVFEPSLFTVRVGTGDLYSDEIAYRVASGVAHPLFKKLSLNTYDYDVALLNVTTPFQFNDTVGAASLIPADRDIAAGTTGIIVGWGYASNTGPGLYRKLRQLALPIHNWHTCDSLPIGKITDRLMCAGQMDGKKDVCANSVGYPLVVNGTLIGVLTSSSGGCAIKNHPSLFVRLAAVRSWITEVSGV